MVQCIVCIYRSDTARERALFFLLCNWIRRFLAARGRVPRARGDAPGGLAALVLVVRRAVRQRRGRARARRRARAARARALPPLRHHLPGTRHGSRRVAERS